MKKRGSVLIFTLWVLIILAILTVVLSYRASSDVKLAKYESDNIKAGYLAKAGIMKMLMELAKDTNAYDSLNEDWNRGEGNPKELRLKNDTVLYGASDETARLNLNAVDLRPEYLAGLGLDSDLSETIVKYKDAKSNKQFEFIEELFLVEGMTREAFLKIKDAVSIYRGADPEANINTSDQKVLEAITGNSGLTQEILDYRNGPDGEIGTADDGIFIEDADISAISGLDPALFSAISSVFRIWAKSILSGDEKIIKSIEAVVDKKTGKIHYWKEY